MRLDIFGCCLTDKNQVQAAFYEQFSTQLPFKGKSAVYSHTLLVFFMLVFHLNCPSLSTLGVSGGEVFVLYLFRGRSYSRETPEGDLHALEQPRADQIHFSAQEHHAHTHTEGRVPSSDQVNL